MRVIDLSQRIHRNMQVFPAYSPPSIIPWANRAVYGFETELIHMATHTGTHVDAPYHFLPDAKKLDQLPITKYVADALVIRLWSGPKALIGPSELEQGQRNGGGIRKGDAVLISTSWEDHLGKRDYLTQYPGLTRESAEYLSSKGASMVGIDTANIDHPDESSFPVHRTLLSREILIVENLCNMASIPSRRFTFLALPLRLKGGTGSPVRAVALLD